MESILQHELIPRTKRRPLAGSVRFLSDRHRQDPPDAMSIPIRVRPGEMRALKIACGIAVPRPRVLAKPVNAIPSSWLRCDRHGWAGDGPEAACPYCPTKA